MPPGSTKEFLQSEVSESCESLERAASQRGQRKYSEYIKEPSGSRVGQQKFALNSSPDIYKYKDKYKDIHT